MSYLDIAKSILAKNREAENPDDLPAHWREQYEERAAIMQYDGRMERKQADVAAFDDILALMRREGYQL